MSCWAPSPEFGRHVSEIHQELSGEFLIAVADTIMHDPEFNLHMALHAFRSNAPLVTPNIRIMAVGEVNAAVVNRSCHLGILPTHMKQPGLRYESLYREKNQLYCGAMHPFFDKAKPPTLAELKKQETICLMHESRGSAQVQKLGLKRGPLSNTDEATAIYILSGLYIGYLAESYGNRFVAEGKMKALNTPRTSYDIDVCAVVLDSKRRTGVVGLFLNTLLEAHLPSS